VLAQISPSGTVNLKFGSRRGLTERTFGAPTDLAIGVKLLLLPHLQRYIGVGMASFGGSERDIALLRYLGPVGGKACNFFADVATSCECLNGVCLLQGPSPIIVTEDTPPSIPPTNERIIVSADLVVQGYKFVITLNAAGTITITKNASLIMYLTSTMPRTYDLFESATIVGRFEFVSMLNASGVLTDCQQWKFDQEVFLRETGRQYLVVEVSIQDKMCGSSPTTSATPKDEFSTFEIALIVIGAMAIATIGAGY
jgi:hypothetical protein